ncbi:MAG: winged helix-turn-helix transcriptional regulator [Candidatus Omnitrophica bacterium]|nr:winged helix-turn-helix transcriptional regulator [Candidatus Nanoarchaeia archaeon]MDD5551188.1 winged helix-turn-helix transcriptional regulator [Candidatus Omnitrophota bacterium]
MKIRKIIAKTGCIEILLALKEHKKLNFGKLNKITGYSSTTTARLKELLTENLIKRIVNPNSEKTLVEYELTEKGKRLSEIVKDLKAFEEA